MLGGVLIDFDNAEVGNVSVVVADAFHQEEGVQAGLNGVVVVLFLPAHFVLGLFALCDIPDDALDVNGLIVFIVDAGDSDLGVDGASVPVAEGTLIMGYFLAAEDAFAHSFGVIVLVGVDENVIGRADKFLAGIAGHFCRALVGINVYAVEIKQENGVVRLLKEGGIGQSVLNTCWTLRLCGGVRRGCIPKKPTTECVFYTTEPTGGSIDHDR